MYGKSCAMRKTIARVEKNPVPTVVQWVRDWWTWAGQIRTCGALREDLGPLFTCESIAKQRYEYR